MSKDPAFLFYSKDWIEGTAELLPEEKGVYIDLLAYQHQRGNLPNDTKRLAQIVRMSVVDFEKIWAVVGLKFKANGDRLVNQRLSDVMTERSSKAIKNKITGTFASVLRLGKYSQEQYQFLRKGFKVDEFLTVPSEQLTDWLTEWCGIRLESIETANGNENGTVNGNLKGGAGEKFKSSAETYQEQLEIAPYVNAIKRGWGKFCTSNGLFQPTWGNFDDQNLGSLVRRILALCESEGMEPSKELMEDTAFKLLTEITKDPFYRKEVNPKILDSKFNGLMSNIKSKHDTVTKSPFR